MTTSEWDAQTEPEVARGGWSGHIPTLDDYTQAFAALRLQAAAVAQMQLAVLREAGASNGMEPTGMRLGYDGSGAYTFIRTRR